MIERGAKTVLIRPAPVPGYRGSRSFGYSEFDPFWKAVEEADILVSMHSSDSGYTRYQNDWIGQTDEMLPFRLDPFRAISVGKRPMEDTMTAYLCHGVFSRFPKLRVASIESGGDWVAGFLEHVADTYKKMPQAFEEDPVEQFKTHVWISPFHEDNLGRLIDTIGADHVLFGSDYPHPEGLAEPRSYAEHLPAGLSDEDMRKIMGGNLARDHEGRRAGRRRGVAPPPIAAPRVLTIGSARPSREPDHGESEMPDYKYVLYETVDDGTIARIMLNRPDARNAQNRGLLVELNDAFLQAEADDTVRVVILGGTGTMFSSGHDLGSKASREEYTPGPNQHPSHTINGATRKGAESLMLQEWHYFFENTRRWRNLRKITIGQAHGDVYAAGLMLLWACDLIVAAEGTRFADVVGSRLGMCGVEYFAHPWEFGPRKAKELLLTGDSIDAEEAHGLGMVSKIFPQDELEERTVEFARRIAQLPTMTSLLIKESVNQSVDNMGFYNALNACFTLHELNHSHWAWVNEDRFPVAKEDSGIPNWKEAPPIVPAVKDKVRADS